MYSDRIEQPFDSIESAQDFMKVLADTILDTVKDLNLEHQMAVSDGKDRRAQAIALAQFKVKMLGRYVHKSRIALNDLRMLRRVILNERLPLEKAMAAGD